jgi:hypothetical protein
MGDLGSKLLVNRYRASLLPQNILQKRGISKILVALVAIVVLAAAFFGVYSWLSNTHSNSTVKIAGVCGAVTYLVPDTTSVTVRNVTEAIGNTTTIFQSISTLSPSTETIGSTSYATTTYGSESSSYVTTNTTYIPASFGEWAVIVCTFTP